PATPSWQRDIVFSCSAVCFQVLSAEARDRRPMTLRRTKREWILPPTKLMENTDYTNTEFIAKIHSDKQTNMEVKYYLSGPGADKPPFNLFVVDYITGFVRITAKLDREKTPFFNLSGRAIFTDGTAAEDDIPLNVIVLDMNDNTPYFELKGLVLLGSTAGTLVMQIQGKDDDEAGTDNSKISYSIASQEPRGTGHMFTIDAETGQLYVKEATLDRETCDFYKLVVHGSDLGGAPGGRTGTGTVEIRVLDINDNIPTLEKSEYNGNVDENVADVVVMRIKALDNDLAHTDNWVTVFEIAKGNENNLFSIETDRKTNEGILKLIKVRYVTLNTVPGVGVGLKPGVKPGVKPGTKPPAKTYPLKIAVNNVPEGPAFIPDTKKVPVSEDPKEAPKDGVITVFTAVDPDTGKTAEDVSYAKAYDPDKWFTIDKETAEIKLIKVPDRESPFLVNGTYIAKILAITKDMPSKTATGTIAIQVLDHNDHCPTLTTTRSTLCSDVKTVNVTGFDEDVSPNAAPFTFRIIPKGTRGSWDVEVINETSAALHSREALWPGSYQLQVEVVDAKGLSCPANEIFTVDVCTCVDTGDCRVKAARLGSTSSKFSITEGFYHVDLDLNSLYIDLNAVLLSAVIPLLLLFFQCGGAGTIFPDQFSDLPFDAKEHLMSYHTEGRGEDKVSRDNYGNGGAAFGMQQFGVQHTTSLFDDIALSDVLRKAMCAVPLNDGLLEYGFEGQGSSAGSVGCCSLLESDNDLHFLDDLGFKFKTLAEICSTVSTALPPMTLPPSKVTNIGHSSNISHSASLPRQTQTVILQQQPVYYTTSPVLQPMHYVVQPRLQNTVLLASGAPRANLPGMYVVSGSQSTSSGLLIRGPQGSPSGPVIQKNVGRQEAAPSKDEVEEGKQLSIVEG
uniref:Si:ch73-74h11.1 n=1 Tax=Sander lucioperca TaxID=283035 RepID=A0A8D0A915_SANLU